MFQIFFIFSGNAFQIAPLDNWQTKQWTKLLKALCDQQKNHFVINNVDSTHQAPDIYRLNTRDGLHLNIRNCVAGNRFGVFRA